MAEINAIPWPHGSMRVFGPLKQAYFLRVCEQAEGEAEREEERQSQAEDLMNCEIRT